MPDLEVWISRSPSIEARSIDLRNIILLILLVSLIVCRLETRFVLVGV